MKDQAGAQITAVILCLFLLFSLVLAVAAVDEASKVLAGLGVSDITKAHASVSR